MPSKKRTTVVVTEAARQIMLRHKLVYGLKEILSVGLHLFDALDAAQREEWVQKIASEEAAYRLVAAAEGDAKGRRRKRGHIGAERRKSAG